MEDIRGESGNSASCIKPGCMQQARSAIEYCWLYVTCMSSEQCCTDSPHLSAFCASSQSRAMVSSAPCDAALPNGGFSEGGKAAILRHSVRHSEQSHPSLIPDEPRDHRRLCRGNHCRHQPVPAAAWRRGLPANTCAADGLGCVRRHSSHDHECTL